MTNIRAALLATLALSGCTYIDNGDYQAALCLLDEDNDGDPRCGPSGTEADGDCNDKDPEMSNLRQETGTDGAYDGKDNDCRDGDLLDVDGDGFLGITRAEYEAIPDADPWPSGAREELDCLDLPLEGFETGYEATVYPGASEQWYDGIDGNCAFDNDFDQDGDGHATALDEYAADYATYRTTLPASIDYDNDDCLDTNSSVHPGTTTPEQYYDGIDQDCDGENDFDPDGDGRLTAGYDDDAEVYKTKFKYDDMTWIPDADCLDIGDVFPDEPAPDDLLAASAYYRIPGDGCDIGDRSCETVWYDGYDDACDEAVAGGIVMNDFDQDGDGYMPNGLEDEFLAYVKRYLGFTDTLGRTPYASAFRTRYGSTDASILDYYYAHDNDCDDRDPATSPEAAAINPDALEKLGDSFDQDCDGGNDTSPLSFDQISWWEPGPPRMTRTDEHHVLIAAATDGVDVGQGFGRQDARVVAVSWSVDAQPGDPATVDESPYAVINATNVLHPAANVTALGDSYFVGASWSAPPRTRLQFSLSGRTSSTAANYQVTTQNDSGSRLDQRTYTDGDLRCDSTTSTCWQVACDGDTLHWVEFDQATGLAVAAAGWDDSIDAVDCFVLPGSANAGTLLIGAVLADGTVETYEEDLGALTFSGTNPFSSIDADWTRSHDDWLIFGLATGGIRAFRTAADQAVLFSGYDLDDADIVRVGSVWYAAALRNSGNVILAYGSTSSPTEVPMPLDAPDGPLDASSVAISADADRVVFVVEGSDGTDRIGWTLLEP